MFEILQLFETAKNEKHITLKFFYVNYVRYKLKNKFFKEYKARIHCMPFDKDMIEEFNQFFNCTKKEVYTGYSNENPIIHYASSEYGLAINYGKYFLRFRFKENICDIDIEKPNGITVSIHPENEKFYSSFFSEIIIMAIYNYCVSYIYGENSSLYIYHDYYKDKIESMYF